ncbi:TetR/AcrR family transcriptional regulator [Chelatococcus reniformis]|uniref:TetR family transcriptional regulator n=1 Tax=Chelatococcus reniformis TaxID=1494448 RepID=A0A916UK07_9HYPH|nr:TetR/AcrR family transcriptional regulator [Chelatococcus reniformis]GGC75140.1 TetR family transcriptional regulator [Chelatococcus reniformis]
MKPRDTSATRQRILAAADRLFYGQGIRAVGVDTIAAGAGISKRTLYNHFPSKDELIVAYLQGRMQPPRPASGDPAGEVLRLFKLMSRVFAQEGFRGCPFVNAVAEVGDDNPAARALAVAFKEQRRLWFRDLLVLAEARDADGLAMQLMLLLDGAIAAALVRRDPSVADAACAAVRTLLAAAGVPADRLDEVAAAKPRTGV